jgi:hypothetical protein
MFKKELSKIKFLSTIEGLETIEDCKPRPAKYFIPDWFKDMPLAINGNVTAKHCPSFPDYFSQGYILPMWTDLLLKNDDIGWQWKTPIDGFNMETHGNFQFLDHVDASFNGVPGQFIFKTSSPWKIITPPGWSVLQLPLFYHFNREWSVLPGIIDTDTIHSLNQQILYHGDGKEIKIKCGDPLVLYVPFKRSNKLKLEVRHQTKKEEKKTRIDLFNLQKNFPPNGNYREMQRRRDNGKTNE